MIRTKRPRAPQAIERIHPRKARLDAEDEGWRDLDDVAHRAFARGAVLFDRDSVQIAVDCFEMARTHAHRRTGWLADYNLACALMLRRAFGGGQEDRERALSLFAGVVSRSNAETSFVHKTHKRIIDCVYDLQETARVNQSLAGKAGGARVGYWNPLLYATVGVTGAFHGIAKGTNDAHGNMADAYPAAHGWDACTGRTRMQIHVERSSDQRGGWWHWR